MSLQTPMKLIKGVLEILEPVGEIINIVEEILGTPEPRQFAMEQGLETVPPGRVILDRFRVRQTQRINTNPQF